MAPFGSSSSMARDIKIGATAFLLTMWIGYFLITGAAAIPRAELDDMIPVLSRRGYNRFGIAIKTSDLIKDCVALDILTLLAPTDESMEVAHISGESGLRSHAISDRILLPSPAILTTLLPNHTPSIAVHRTRRTVHIAVNGVPLQSPGLYHSSHGLAGALVPLSHFPSCCLPQSPIRATFAQTPSRSAYAGPHALQRPQSASSNGDLLPPRPPETLDISIGFSISSTIAALTATAFAASVFIHLFEVPIFPPIDDTVPVPELVDDMFVVPELVGPPPQHFASDEDEEGLFVILEIILNTLRVQFISVVTINHEALYQVSREQLGFRLRRYYIDRISAMDPTPDDVILVIEMPDWTRLHLGRFPRYFMNSQLYDNSFVLRIFPAQAGLPPILN